MGWRAKITPQAGGVVIGALGYWVVEQFAGNAVTGSPWATKILTVAVCVVVAAVILSGWRKLNEVVPRPWLPRPWWRAYHWLRYRPIQTPFMNVPTWYFNDQTLEAATLYLTVAMNCERSPYDTVFEFEDAHILLIHPGKKRPVKFRAAGTAPISALVMPAGELRWVQVRFEATFLPVHLTDAPDFTQPGRATLRGVRIMMRAARPFSGELPPKHLDYLPGHVGDATEGRRQREIALRSL